MPLISRDHRHTLRRLVILGGMLPLLIALGSERLLADNDGPVRFHDVTSWRGSFVAWARQNSVENLPGGRGSVKVYYNCYFTADFLLDEFEDEPAKWSGRLINPQMESSYRGVAKKVIDIKEGNTTEELESFDTSGPPEEGGSPVELLFHRERGWSFHIGTPGRSAQLSEEITLTTKKGVMLHQQTQREILATAESGTATFPYPAKGMILFAGDKKAEGARSIPGAIAGDIVWEYTVYLEPASMEELRLVIEEPTDYKKWRPETTLEAGPGPALEVAARVETVRGAKPKVGVEQFIWELEDTSFEPGVAMNFPVQAGGADFDLNLEATGGYFELSPNKQKVTRAVQQGHRDSVKVVPYDWGAWTKLQVTAVMTDGRRIKGKLQGKPEYGLRVPKRTPDSKIADAWKEKNKSGADDLDDENEPEGDGHKGDGFTLYEEYRGFIVKGQHVDGDPKKKDFFVMNLIGADAEMGIGLFEALSEFRVHRLERNEMHTGVREMNTNRAKGAHNKDQHGVVLGAGESAAALAGKPADVFGAMTYAIDEADKGLVFQPASTKIIGILPDGHPESLFSKPGNLSASDGSITFFRAVAHELMHSVGVEEHGDGDGQAEFVFISPKNTRNSVGRPYYAFKDSPEKPVPLLNEQGHDMAAIVYPRYAAERVKWLDFYRSIMIGKPGDSGYPRMSEQSFQDYCEYEMQSTLALSGQVGAEHGQHAGNQDCIMRYHFANFYPFTGRRDAFYMIEPGAERMGLTLCRSPAGTGVNASSNTPQSRHGDAWPGTGDCASKICPNDAVTPRKSALPVK